MECLLWITCQLYSVKCVSKINSVLSITFYASCAFLADPFIRWWCENMCCCCCCSSSSSSSYLILLLLFLLLLHHHHHHMPLIGISSYRWGLVFNSCQRSVFNGQAPFYYHWVHLIPAWISNHTYYKECNEITYPFPNFNGATVEVWKWISNFIPLFLNMRLLIHTRIKVNPCK